MCESDASDTTLLGRRGLARLYAVQALYQIEISGDASWQVIDEFIGFRVSGEISGSAVQIADLEFFRDLVSGVDIRNIEISKAIESALMKSWTYERLDTTLRQILRAATYELLSRRDIPVRVVINEYVELTSAFFESSESSFVNAILDSLGRQFRDREMTFGCH